MSQPPLDLNAELDAARRAVGRRNCAAAVAHLVNVVPHAPAHPAVTAVLDDLVAAAPDPRQLVPSGPASYGAAAVHAYALGKAGQAGEAYQVLRQLVPANPGNGVIDWALSWLEAGALTAAQQAEAVSLFFASAHHRGFGNRPRLEPHEADLVRRWLPHIEAVLKGRPLDDPLYSMFVPLLRKTGRQEEAMRTVRARHAAAPSYESAVSLAATLRDGRDFAGWFTASQECLKFRPNDIATRLDLGDCFWEDQGKLEEAERWYADALRLQPDEPWAAPSLLAVRRLHTDEARWRDELEAYALAHPDNRRARVVLGRITPFFADFFHPADATVNLVNQLADQVEQAIAKGGSAGSPSGTIDVTTTGLEYPSCRYAIDRQLQLWGGKIELRREIRGMQSPDPRQPRVPVRYRIWEYDGLTPRPAVAPPPPEVAELVGAMAHTRYDLGTWSGYAENVAGRLGPKGLPGLLGVMAHPPAPRAGWRMWDSMSRVQVAAALVIGHLEKTWEGSVRRQALVDLANGPADWTTLAAVVALTAAALEEPAIAPEVGRLFAGLYKDLPRPGAEWYENTILNCHLRLPGLSEAERQAVRAARAEYESRSTKPLTDAEGAARLFLARPLPKGVEANDLARLVIQGFAHPAGRDHPGFAPALQTSLRMTEGALAAAEGELKEYLREQAAVLRLIEREITLKSGAAAGGTGSG